MEHLLIRRVGWRSDPASVRRGSDILDVRKHGRRPVDQARVLLPAADAADVRRHAGVDYDVVLAGVRVDAQPAQDGETAVCVDFPG